MLNGVSPRSVLVVSSNASGQAHLMDALDPMEFSPISSAGSAGEARRRLMAEIFDLVLINAPLSDEPGYDLALDAAEKTMSGILLLVKHELYDVTRYRVESAGVFTLPKPFSAALFNTAIQLAAASRERLRRLQNENKKLKVKIDEIRIVNRAKWALIEYLGMTEAQAHKYIEKQAMDMRQTKQAIAENIIITYESKK